MKKRVLVTVLAFVLLVSAILIPAIVSAEKTEAAAYTEYRYFHLDQTKKIGYIGKDGWANFAKFINNDQLYQDDADILSTVENDYGKDYTFYLVGDVTVEWGVGSLKEFKGKLAGNMNTVTFTYSGNSGGAADFSRNLLTNSARVPDTGKACLGGLIGNLNGGTVQLLNCTFANNAETVVYLDAAGFDDVDPTGTASDGNDIYDSLYIGGIVGYMENGAKIEKVSSLCGAVKFNETAIRGISLEQCNERTDYYAGGVVGGSGGGSVSEVWSTFDVGLFVIYNDARYTHANGWVGSSYVSGDANENYYDVFAGGIAGVCKAGTTIRNCYTNASVSALANDSQTESSGVYAFSGFAFGQKVFAGGIAGSCGDSSGNTISNCAPANPYVTASCYQQAYDYAYILDYMINMFNYSSMQDCCRANAAKYVKYDGKSSAAVIANGMTAASVPTNVAMTSAVLGSTTASNMAMVNSYSYSYTASSGACYATAAGPVANSSYLVSDLNNGTTAGILNGSGGSAWTISGIGKLTMSWLDPTPQNPTISWTSGAADGAVTVKGIASELYDSVKLYFKVLFYTQGKFGKATGASVSAGATAVDGINLRLYPADASGNITDYADYILLSDTEPTKVETGGYYRMVAELAGTNLDSLTSGNVATELSAQDSAHNIYLTNRTDGKPDGFFDLSTGLTLSTTENYDITLSAKATVTISGATATKSVSRQIKLVPVFTGIMPDTGGGYTLPTVYNTDYGVYPGNIYAFSATAKGIGSMSGFVTWSLSGKKEAGTSVNATTGVLTLAAAERGSYDGTLGCNVLTLKATTKGADPVTKEIHLAVMNPLKSYTIACAPETLVEDGTASAALSVGSYTYTFENITGSNWNPTETPALVSWQKKVPGETAFSAATAAATYSVNTDNVLPGYIVVQATVANQFDQGHPVTLTKNLPVKPIVGIHDSSSDASGSYTVLVPTGGNRTETFTLTGSHVNFANTDWTWSAAYADSGSSEGVYTYVDIPNPKGNSSSSKAIKFYYNSAHPDAAHNTYLITVTPKSGAGNEKLSSTSTAETQNSLFASAGIYGNSADHTKITFTVVVSNASSSVQLSAVNGSSGLVSDFESGTLGKKYALPGDTLTFGTVSDLGSQHVTSWKWSLSSGSNCTLSPETGATTTVTVGSAATSGAVTLTATPYDGATALTAYAATYDFNTAQKIVNVDGAGSATIPNGSASGSNNGTVTASVSGSPAPVKSYSWTISAGSTGVTLDSGTTSSQVTYLIPYDAHSGSVTLTCTVTYHTGATASASKSVSLSYAVTPALSQYIKYNGQSSFVSYTSAVTPTTHRELSFKVNSSAAAAAWTWSGVSIVSGTTGTVSDYVVSAAQDSTDPNIYKVTLKQSILGGTWTPPTGDPPPEPGTVTSDYDGKFKVTATDAYSDQTVTFEFLIQIYNSYSWTAAAAEPEAGLLDLARGEDILSGYRFLSAGDPIETQIAANKTWFVGSGNTASYIAKVGFPNYSSNSEQRLIKYILYHNTNADAESLNFPVLTAAGEDTLANASGHYKSADELAALIATLPTYNSKETNGVTVSGGTYSTAGVTYPWSATYGDSYLFIWAQSEADSAGRSMDSSEVVCIQLGNNSCDAAECDSTATNSDVTAWTTTKGDEDFWVRFAPNGIIGAADGVWSGSTWGSHSFTFDLNEMRKAEKLASDGTNLDTLAAGYDILVTTWYETDNIAEASLNVGTRTPQPKISIDGGYKTISISCANISGSVSTVYFSVSYYTVGGAMTQPITPLNAEGAVNGTLGPDYTPATTLEAGVVYKYTGSFLFPETVGGSQVKTMYVNAMAKTAESSTAAVSFASTAAFSTRQTIDPVAILINGAAYQSGTYYSRESGSTVVMLSHPSLEDGYSGPAGKILYTTKNYTTTSLDASSTVGNYIKEYKKGDQISLDIDPQAGVMYLRAIFIPTYSAIYAAPAVTSGTIQFESYYSDPVACMVEYDADGNAIPGWELADEDPVTPGIQITAMESMKIAFKIDGDDIPEGMDPAKDGDGDDDLLTLESGTYLVPTLSYNTDGGAVYKAYTGYQPKIKSNGYESNVLGADVFTLSATAGAVEHYYVMVGDIAGDSKVASQVPAHFEFKVRPKATAPTSDPATPDKDGNYTMVSVGDYIRLLSGDNINANIYYTMGTTLVTPNPAERINWELKFKDWLAENKANGSGYQVDSSDARDYYGRFYEEEPNTRLYTGALTVKKNSQMSLYVSAVIVNAEDADGDGNYGSYGPGPVANFLFKINALTKIGAITATPETSVAEPTTIKRNSRINLSTSVTNTTIYYTINSSMPSPETRIALIDAIAKFKDYGYDSRFLLPNEIALLSNYYNGYDQSEVGYDGDGTDTLATLIYDSSTGVRMDPESGSTTFTIHAVAVHNNGLYEDSEIYRFDYTLLQLGPITATPATSTTEPTTLKRGDKIILTAGVTGSTIYYTTNGTLPNYPERNALDAAIAAYKADGTENDILTKYSYDPAAGTDTLATKVYNPSTGVPMDPDSGSEIFTIYAMVTHSLYADSVDYRFDYKLKQASPVTAVAPAIETNGEISIVEPGQTISLFTETPGARIYYTEDGSIPNPDLCDARVPLLEAYTAARAAYDAYITEHGSAPEAESEIYQDYAEATAALDSYDTAHPHITLLYDPATGITMKTKLKTTYTILAVAAMAADSDGKREYSTSDYTRFLYQLPAEVNAVYGSIPSGTSVAKGTTITLNTITSGAVIYYEITTDGAEPKEPVQNESMTFSAGQTITVNQTTKIKAFAVKNRMVSATTSLVYKALPQLSAPSASIATGSLVGNGSKVTLKTKSVTDLDTGVASALSAVFTSTEIANITYAYTLDGSDPVAAVAAGKALYGNSVLINGKAGDTVVVAAYAMLKGATHSDVSYNSYTIASNEQYLTVSPANGSVITSGTTVTMTSSVGGTIYYTTDGENPTEDSDDGTSVKIKGEPGESIVLKICIFDDEGNPGAIATYTYTIMEKAAAPSSSIASGYYFMSGATVELSVTEGAIYYTTDGSDPTTSSNLYKDPITLTGSVVIKAVCVVKGKTNSDIAQFVYTKAGTVSAPEFSITSGEVEQGTAIEITSATDGASIYYSTSGVTPSADNLSSMTLYSGPITVTRPATIKAVAVKTNLHNSPVNSATYTVTVPVDETPAEDMASAQIGSSTGRLASRRTYSDSETGPTYDGIVLTNTKYGALVDSEKGVLDSGATLVVTESTITPSEEVGVTNINGYKVVKVYEVRLMKDGDVIEPEGAFEFGLAIGAEYQNSIVELALVKDNGTVEAFSTRRSGGIAYVETDSLGRFAVTVPGEETEGGQNRTALIAGSVIAAGVAAGGGTLLYLQSKKKKLNPGSPAE